MTYIVYSNIDRPQLIYLKSKLESIELSVSPFLKKYHFYLNRKNTDEYLVLDYLYEQGDYMGSIGIGYDESKSTTEQKIFSVRVGKNFR